ncbi:Immunoglobulin I-set domain, partial [Popillia japonica]
MVGISRSLLRAQLWVSSVMRKLFQHLEREPTGAVGPRLSNRIIDIKSIDVGESLVALCPAQAFPVPIFRWYKFVEGSNRKQAIQLNDRIHQVAGTLIIREALVEDSGKYLCVVNNSVGGESVETVLTVTAPLKATINPPMQTIDFGRPAVFTCNFEDPPVRFRRTSHQCVVTKGLVPIEIRWEFHGKSLNDNNSNGISLMLINPKIASLSIDSVNADHAGNYTCIAENAAGTLRHTAELNVIVIPQISPFNFKDSTDSGETVSVQCTVSKGDLPLNITWQLNNRTIDKDGGITVMTMKRFSTLNIDSVQDVHTGEYTCTAQNLAGHSVYSARLNVN